MTVIPPKAGAGPQAEDGPGAAFAGRPVDLSDAFPYDMTACAAIGRLGARTAGLALRLDPEDQDGALDIAVVDKQGNALLRLGPLAAGDVDAGWGPPGAASGQA